MKTKNAKLQIELGRGFTLVELIIAGGILIIITSIILGVYFPSFGAQLKSIDYSRLQQETQIVLEIMAKDIRTKDIWYDYPKYGGIINSTGEPDLALKDAGGNYVIFCEIAGEVKVFRETNPSPIPTDCTGNPLTNFASISASDITITNLNFFIKPSSDPFQFGATDIRQPRVTIVIEAEKQSGSKALTAHFQTTISQRFTEKR